MVKNKGKLIGIDKNFIADTFVGIIVGVAILVISFLVPGISTIGTPSTPISLSSDASRFVVVVLLASVFETFFFFSVVLSFFSDKISRFGIKLPFIVSASITAIIFTLFHFSAYNFGAGGTSGAFISAGIIGLVFAYQTKFTNSAIPALVTHSLLNFWISFGSGFVIFG